MTLWQLVFLGKDDPNFPWENSHWENSVYKLHWNNKISDFQGKALSKWNSTSNNTSNFCDTATATKRQHRDIFIFCIYIIYIYYTDPIGHGRIPWNFRSKVLPCKKSCKWPGYMCQVKSWRKKENQISFRTNETCSLRSVYKLAGTTGKSIQLTRGSQVRHLYQSEGVRAARADLTDSQTAVYFPTIHNTRVHTHAHNTESFGFTSTTAARVSWVRVRSIAPAQTLEISPRGKT